MSKKKNKHHKLMKSAKRVNPMPFVGVSCGYIFDKLCTAPISNDAFGVALDLYDIRESVSRQYPGVEQLARELEMTPELVRNCEAELTKAGILLHHEDGTFDMKDLAEKECTV
jgi:hypothetical protein